MYTYKKKYFGNSAISEKKTSSLKYTNYCPEQNLFIFSLCKQFVFFSSGQDSRTQYKANKQEIFQKHVHRLKMIYQQNDKHG